MNEHDKTIERFKRVVRLGRNPGTHGEMKAAAEAAWRLLKRYPWLRDTAALLGVPVPGEPGTRPFPFLHEDEEMKAKARTKTEPKRPEPPPRRKAGRPPRPRPTAAKPWVKTPLPPGYEWKQCGKPNCRCMNGGAWHGPYRYEKKWRDGTAHSDYVGREYPSDDKKTNK